MIISRFLHRPGWRGALLGLSCALAAWLLAQLPFMRGLEGWAEDGCLIARGVRPSGAAQKIVLVGLDDRSLDELGKPLVMLSPELAEVVRYAHRSGAKVVGLDVMVPEKLRSLPGLEGGKLGEAALEAGNVVLPAWKQETGWLLPLREWQAHYFLTADPTDFGFVNYTEDPDGTVRRQQLIAGDDAGMGAASYSFALALLARARGEKPAVGSPGLRLGSLRVPLDTDLQMRVNYVGPPGTFPIVPFRSVLAAARGGPSLADRLRGAIVLVGGTALSQQDRHSTPYSNDLGHGRGTWQEGLMYGVELHANVLATLADGAFVTTPAWLSPLPVLLVAGLLLGSILVRVGLMWGAAVVAAFLGAWWEAAALALRYAGWSLAFVPVALLGLLAYACIFAYRWWWIRGTFGLFKSLAFVEVLEANPEGVLRGTEGEVSVLFCDIRNFTRYSERHQPQEIVALLNAYFSAVVPVLEAHGGHVNNYMGDGMMVLFGAWKPQPDHARRAVRAAAAIVRRVHELRWEWAELDAPEFRIGVGVHTGRAVLGMVGAPRRGDYTAHGDVINAAARIESENKALGTEILISAETYEALPPEDQDGLRIVPEPQPVFVHGKQDALNLYRVSVDPEPARPAVELPA